MKNLSITKCFFLILFVFQLSNVFVYAKDKKEVYLSFGSQQLLQIIMQDEDAKVSKKGALWVIESAPLNPTFIPLQGDSDNYQRFKGKKALTRIIKTYRAFDGDNRGEFFVDILGTYILDGSYKNQDEGVDNCHVCQVLIGIVIYKNTNERPLIIYKNLFLTMDGSWGQPPEINIHEILALNFFKLNLQHSYLSTGQLTRYQYTLLFEDGCWSELERRIEIIQIDGGASDFYTEATGEVNDTDSIAGKVLQSVNPDWMKQLSSTSQFTQKAVINLTNAAVSATIKTAIQGGSYEDNLTASLKTAGIDTVAGWAASNVGQGYKNGDGALSELQGQYIAHKVAHALVGCASAAAKDSSCAAGAIGGAVGEAFAEMYGQSKYGTADGSTLSSVQQQEVLNMSKLVTAAVAGMTGKNAQAAVDAAQNAVINNFLFKQDKKALTAAKAACSSANEAACTQAKNLEARDKTLDQLQEKYSGELTKPQVKALIKDVADVYVDDFKKYGVDANDFLLTMANKESTLNPKENEGTYRGLYQFSENLALNEFNIGNTDASIRLDPVWSTAAAAKSALETAATLTTKGIPVTPENLYIAHQQGMTGFVALFNAPSDELAGMVLSQFKKTEALGFKSVAGNLYGNPIQQAEQAKTLTVSDFLNFLSNSFNSKRLPK